MNLLLKLATIAALFTATISSAEEFSFEFRKGNHILKKFIFKAI